ncbi:TauD/TfdA dioxygenase family protein [Bradyrhizobium acaciae]|uniref:TauD/TfdA dioxygenase family protein n=1 Tax=Bradyrhizobium acaciae TaxID=2683706 RepID=UPI001E45AC53|nr:TauD/TfdA family dioxygenase [Bradyrhizobium acaciae]MCC8984678.1 TauD/TfdA family dioxygenase [Bradyrhizobium acaciae]
MAETALIENVIPRPDVVRRTACIGAEIENIKLLSDLPDQTIAAIKGLLLEHTVIFFRDQGHLDDAEQERFAFRFRMLMQPPPGAAKGTISILEIDSARGGVRADNWHIDVSCLQANPTIAVLRRSVVIPLIGGDAVWANTAAAYLDLAPPLQRLANELWAVHSSAFNFAVTACPSEADEKRDEELLTRTRFETEHSVVRVHPETGERTLVLGSYVNRLVDIAKHDGQWLFDLFEAHVTTPENTVRWNWKQVDVGRCRVARVKIIDRFPANVVEQARRFHRDPADTNYTLCGDRRMQCLQVGDLSRRLDPVSSTKRSLRALGLH